MWKFLLTAIFSILSGQIIAQNGSVSTGSRAKGTGGTVDFSVGQTIYMPTYGIAGSASQGMQQPFIIQAVTGLYVSGINLTMILYPNPAIDFISLKIDKENVDFFESSYTIYNGQGQRILEGMIREKETLIPMKNLESGTYFIKTFIQNKEVKTFRVIKN